MVSRLFYFIALLLFVSNFAICDYFYYNNEVKDLVKWWDLKSIIYSLIVFFVFLGSYKGSKKWSKFILNIGLGFALSNMIDKIFFNITVFNEKDIIMIITTIFFSIYDFLAEQQNERNAIK